MPIFHLSPHGNDRWAGTKNKPWASLAGARDQIRRLRASRGVEGRVTVHVFAGSYPLSQTVEFGPQDSGIRFVAAGPGKPVFDGGVRISGWKIKQRNGREEWIANLPSVADDRWNFRSLFVNGARAPRARLPKFSPDVTGARQVFRVGEIRNPKNTEPFAGNDTFKPRNGDVGDWSSLAHAEFVVLHYWMDQRLPQPSRDTRTGWLRFGRRTAFNLYESFVPLIGSAELARYYIDNLHEALTAPGEWYLDRSVGRLHYLPKPGETPANTSVVAPRITAFVRAEGEFFNDTLAPVDPAATRYIEGLGFDGLSFIHADWYAPVTTFPPHYRPAGVDKTYGGSVQAAFEVPGSIVFRAARDCSVSNCNVSQAGLYGIEFGDGCRSCAAVGNELFDLGGGGIRAHGAELDQSAEKRTGHLQIIDNHISRIGRIFHQGVGIFLGHTFDNLVAHNHIHDTCYTGISVGWTWGFRETVSRNNRIENNLIHDIGAGVLSDMGGIYVLGVQPGTVLRGNHIFKVSAHHYGGWGIYLDEGSQHIVVEHNLVHDTQAAPFNIHCARECTVRHNIFARGKDALVSVYRAEPDRVSATFTHNILVGPSRLLFSGGYAGEIAGGTLQSDANNIWFPGGQMAPSGYPARRRDLAKQRLSLTQWRKAGFDQTSRVGDPQIAIGRNGHWKVAENSPARRIGFRPYDWSICGTRSKRKGRP